MSQEEKQTLTVQYMYGNWTNNKGGSIPYKISIQKFPNKVKLIWEKNEEEFDGNAHWFGENHLCFLGPYYIKVPTGEINPDEIIFGKHKSSVIGDYEWQEIFNRSK